MRVLICARPGTGGAGRVLEALLRRLPEKGITGTAALSPLEGDAVLEVAARAGWDVVPLKMRRDVKLLADAHALFRLRRLAKGHRLVHAHASKAGALARLAGLGAPVVYTPHGFFFTYHPEGSAPRRLYLDLERRLAPRTKILHCVSDAERHVALEHGLATAATAIVIPNPVPPRRGGEGADARARESLRAMGVADTSRVVLMVARLAEPKDPVTFVRAAGLVDADLGATFVLVGDGALAEESRAAAAALPSGRIVFSASVDDVRALLGRCRVAVLSSRSEALPVFLLEALAEGIPAVATDLPGCREASGDAALYVPPGDAAALAAAVTRLLRNERQHRDLARAARARAPRFDEDRWLDAVVAMYRRAAAPAQRA